MNRFAICFLLLAVPLSARAAASTAVPADAAFARLSGLVGQWNGTLADGRVHAVSYRLTAGDSVLVETWTMSPTRESMTMYHLDGDSLIATHYCPQGTQPRLQLEASSTPAKLSFRLRDGTSLQAPERSHQHAMTLEFREDGSFARSETYVPNGTTEAEFEKLPADAAVVFTRVGATGGE
jgi:hypothetical protein